MKKFGLEFVLENRSNKAFSQIMDQQKRLEKQYLNKRKKVLHPDVIVVEEEVEGSVIEIAFQYSEEESCVIKSFPPRLETGNLG